MARLLMQTNGAPADEIDEVYQLLQANHIRFYETDAGRWGFSVAGFWLPDESQWTEAVQLLQEYQRQRQQRVQGEYAELRRLNQHDTLLRRLRRHPIAMLVQILLIIAILYLSLLPFVGLG